MQKIIYIIKRAREKTTAKTFLLKIFASGLNASKEIKIGIFWPLMILLPKKLYNRSFTTLNNKKKKKKPSSSLIR